MSSRDHGDPLERPSAAQLAAFSELLPDAHLLVDADGSLQWANAAALSLFDCHDALELRGRLLQIELAGVEARAVRALCRDAGGGRLQARSARSGRRLLLCRAAGASVPGIAVLAVRPLDAAARPYAGLDGLFGTDFFDALLTELAERSDAFQVFVGELGPAGDSVRTLCARRDGDDLADFTYALAGSPCEAVVAGDVCVFADGVAGRFPGDAELATLGVRGYAGQVLSNSRGEPIGVLVALFREPLVDVVAASTLLADCALRASAELERLQVERALRDSERRYRALVEQAHDGLLVRRGTELLFANQALAEILGSPDVATLLQRTGFDDFASGASLGQLQDYAVARDRGEPAPTKYEIDARRADGGPVRLAVSTSEIDWEGQPALQALVSDVTEQRAMETRLQRAERLESIGKLTGGIAHDFNNLLAVIMGNLELLQQYLDNDEALDIARQAGVAAERGADLTRRLLAFARQQPLAAQAVDPRSLFDDTGALLRRTLGEDVELLLEMALDAPVLADPAQLQTALMNLAINARDALPEGGTVVLRARPPAPAELARLPAEVRDGAGSLAVLEVEDDGPGMVDEVSEHAFEPFFTTKSADRGTGLGLSMVHGFARQSRGWVELDTGAGRGTRVSLYLPVAAAAEPDPTAAEQPAETQPAGGVRKRVLVVEDEAAVREVAVAMLQRLDYEVTQAADGAEARSLLAAQPFDLLLSDVVLPRGERGPEIASDAQRTQPSLRVLFMSGYAQSREFSDGTFDPARQLIAKPFRLDALRQRVMEALDDA